METEISRGAFATIRARLSVCLQQAVKDALQEARLQPKACAQRLATPVMKLSFAVAGVSGAPVQVTRTCWWISRPVPPAKTLLVTDTSKADRDVQASLQKLRTLCGKDVARQEVADAFKLSDIMTPPEQWPQRIPVRCP